MRQLLTIIFALFMAVSVVHQANAHVMSYRVASHHAAVNNHLSAVYDHLLQVNPRFRAWRMWKECHILKITWPPLYPKCLASFDHYEPVLPAYRHHHR